MTRCKQSLNRSRKSRSFQLYLLLNEASISARLRKRHVAVIYLENAIFLSLCQKKKENWSINVAISWPINHDFSLQKASKTHSLCFFPFFLRNFTKTAVFASICIMRFVCVIIWRGKWNDFCLTTLKLDIRYLPKWIAIFFWKISAMWNTRRAQVLCFTLPCHGLEKNLLRSRKNV